MEKIRTARRSASHGSLNRRYAADNASFPPRPLPPHPFSRPLRSVNENASLLASPGPLESMLKTTTETGDISVFSITPSRSSATVYGPFRSRPGYGDVDWPRPPRSRRADTPGLSHERRRLPSYRDTASEIISMHGSESQRSASSSFSHPFDEGPRSCSMTSYGSRPLPNKKSNGTLQSQPSASFLQRPRSPFPYPTRLKRPGVRPASPAWTENGGVDYSRMIQIDRLPHRTIHGLYKPTYPHYGHHRGNPGLVRFDNNRPVPSLSSYNTPPDPQYSSGQTSSAPTTWDTRSRRRLDSSTSDNSAAASTLTSIVDMYRPSSCAPPTHDSYFRTHPGGAFYYDYSEDFDQPPEDVMPPLDTLAPIPTRAASLHRPMVLDEACNLRFPESTHQDPATVFRTASPMETAPGQNTLNYRDDFECPMENYFNVPPGEGPRISKVSNHRDSIEYQVSPSTDGLRPITEITHASSMFPAPVDGVQPVSGSRNHNIKDSGLEEEITPRSKVRSLGDSEDQDAPTPANSQRHKECCDSPKHIQSCSASQIRSSSQPPGVQRSLSLSCAKKGSIYSTVSGCTRRSKFYPLESGLSDLASLVQCLDSEAQFPVLNDTSTDTVIVNHDGETEEDRKPENVSVHEPQQSRNTDMDMDTARHEDNCMGSGEDPKVFRGHRRRFAISNFDTESSSATHEAGSPLATEEPIHIFAPQPVSPARRLGLQNSVPQLMRALPSLPSSSESNSFAHNVLFNGPDTTMLFSPAHEEDASLMLSELTEEHKNHRLSNAKLKLKVSRGAMSKVQEASDSHRPTMDTRPSRLWLGPPSDASRECEEHSYQEDSFNIVSKHPSGEPWVVSAAACHEEVAPIDGSTPTGSVIKLSATVTEESIASDSASPQRTVKSDSIASVGDIRSIFSDGSTGSRKPPRGLRKRVSHLRIRVAESRLRVTGPKDVTGKDIDRIRVTSGAIASTSIIRETDEAFKQQPNRSGLQDTPGVQHMGFRGRMSKWMKTVRQAVMVACTGPGKRA